MKREVTPTENAILDMLHQVQHNQEAEMEATARHTLDREFEKDADTSFPKILLADTLNMQTAILNAYSPPQKPYSELSRREKQRREQIHRFESARRQRAIYRERVMEDPANKIWLRVVRTNQQMRRTRFLTTPVILKTQPEVIDIESRTEARMGFGWMFEMDRGQHPAGKALAALAIYKVISDEYSGKQSYERAYTMTATNAGGNRRVELQSPELEAYIKALQVDFKKEHGPRARFNRSTVLVPDEFCYQPIGFIEQGLQELSSMQWKPQALPFPVVE